MPFVRSNRGRKIYYARRRRPSYTKRKRMPSAMRRTKRRQSAVRRTLPDYTRVALRYQNIIEEFTLNSTPNTMRQWRLNSMYDPNYTITNPGQHQPYGYDQLMTFFQKYRVHATKVRFTFFNPTDDTSQGAMADADLMTAIWPSPDSSTSLPGTNMNILDEVAKARRGILSRKVGTSQRSVLSGYFKMHKLMGVSKKEYNTDQNFEAFWTQNPTSTPLMNIICYNPRNLSDTGTFDLKINMTFYATLFRKKIPDMS